MATTAADRRLGELPLYAALLKQFRQKEVRPAGGCCLGGVGVCVPGGGAAPPAGVGSRGAHSCLMAACPWYPLSQVLWWKHVESEYSGEIEAQADVFGGEGGAKRQAGASSGSPLARLAVACPSPPLACLPS